MRRQMFTIFLGDRYQYVGKRHFCFRFTYLTKKILLYIYILYLKAGFVFFRIKWVFLKPYNADSRAKIDLFIYWGFTPLSSLFQLYHGDSSLIHDPWVNKPVLG